MLLFEALRAACVDVRFFSIPDVGHEHPYLGDLGAAAQGWFVQTVKGCDPPTWGCGGLAACSGQVPPPTYDTLLAFFDALLK